VKNQMFRYPLSTGKYLTTFRGNRLRYSPISSRPGLLWTVLLRQYALSQGQFMFTVGTASFSEGDESTNLNSCGVPCGGGQVKSKSSFITTSDLWATNG